MLELFNMSIVTITQALVIPTFANTMIINEIDSVVAKRRELENSSVKARQAPAQKPRPSIAACTNSIKACQLKMAELLSEHATTYRCRCMQRK